MFMESWQYPCLSLTHHPKILSSMNLLFQFFPLRHSHVNLVFLQKCVLVSEPSLWTCFGLVLFRDDDPLVFHLAHLCDRDEMKLHGVYHDFWSDFLIYGVFLLYVSIFVAYWFVENANVAFYLYLVYYHDGHGNVIWIFASPAINLIEEILNNKTNIEREVKYFSKNEVNVPKLNDFCV